MGTALFEGRWLVLSLLVIATVISGCALDQTHSTVDYETFSLSKDDLVKYGLAFITPSTVTGQEQDKQTLAFIFANVMRERRADLECQTL